MFHIGNKIKPEHEKKKLVGFSLSGWLVEELKKEKNKSALVEKLLADYFNKNKN